MQPEPGTEVLPLPAEVRRGILDACDRTDLEAAAFLLSGAPDPVSLPDLLRAAGQRFSFAPPAQREALALAAWRLCSGELPLPAGAPPIVCGQDSAGAPNPVRGFRVGPRAPKGIAAAA